MASEVGTHVVFDTFWTIHGIGIGSYDNTSIYDPFMTPGLGNLSICMHLLLFSLPCSFRSCLSCSHSLASCCLAQSGEGKSGRFMYSPCLLPPTSDLPPTSYLLPAACCMLRANYQLLYNYYIPAAKEAKQGRQGREGQRQYGYKKMLDVQEVVRFAKEGGERKPADASWPLIFPCGEDRNNMLSRRKRKRKTSKVAVTSLQKTSTQDPFQPGSGPGMKVFGCCGKETAAQNVLLIILQERHVSESRQRYDKGKIWKIKEKE